MISRHVSDGLMTYHIIYLQLVNCDARSYATDRIAKFVSGIVFDEAISRQLVVDISLAVARGRVNDGLTCSTTELWSS